MFLAVNEWTPPRPTEEPAVRIVRYRTVGDSQLHRCGASDARSVE